MRIALVAHGHFPIRSPYAGGLETFTAQLAGGLRARGHHVLLHAAHGTDPALADELVTFDPSPHGAGRVAHRVTGAPDPVDHPETRAYLGVVADLVRRDDVDVVANHSLQPTLLANSPALGPAVVTSFHTPLLEPVARAVGLADRRARYTAVSEVTAAEWRAAGCDPVVIRNGVDPQVFAAGPGGPRAVWTGRLRPDKGADLAIAAARRAGVGLDLAGPVSDPDWFEQVLVPLLGGSVRYLGALDHTDLAALVGSSLVAFVTPRWEEPFGLVAAEALMCGTPVVGLGRGAVREVVGDAGVVVPDDDTPDDVLVAGLADGIAWAAALPREQARTRALEHFSVDRMLDEYERLYAEVAVGTTQEPPLL